MTNLWNLYMVLHNKKHWSFIKKLYIFTVFLSEDLSKTSALSPMNNYFSFLSYQNKKKGELIAHEQLATHLEIIIKLKYKKHWTYIKFLFNMLDIYYF